MEKTYKLVNHSDPLSIDEIKQLYTGHWVYIVKAKVGEYGEILSGLPVVIGSRAADGAEDGIYDMYRADEYDIRAGLNLLTNKWIISPLRFTGGING